MDYDRLRPQTIELAPVQNRTVYPLKSVSFGGTIQRNLLGARPYDIPFLLRSSCDELLSEKGYRTVVRERVREIPSGDTPSGDVDAQPEWAAATFTCTIESWSAGTGSLPYMKLIYRIEIRQKNGDTELFNTTSTATADGRSMRRSIDVERAIRSSVRHALSELPDA